MVTHDPIIRFYDDPGHPYWPNNTASIKAEIMAIATEHGYTGAVPKTIAGAIDALADTLAGEDVSSGRSIAGAIHALAPYIGTGGGGAELGPLQLAPLVYASNTPAVGENLDTEEYSLDMKAGDIEVVEHGKVASNEIVMKVAANATVTLYVTAVTSLSAAYVVTYQNPMPFSKITNVAEWDGEYTFTPSDGDSIPSVTFTMPELGENQVLAFKVGRIG